MTIRVIALALWFGTTGASQPAADRIAEQAMATVLDAPAATNQVWPGFALPSRNFAIYTAAGTYLHAMGPVPEGFARRGRWWFRPGALAGLTEGIDVAYPVGDLHVTVVPNSQSTARTIRTLYHEAFHAFQKEHPGRLLPPDSQAEPLTREQAASIEVERRVLAQALRYPTRAQQFLLDALAIRRERTAANGASVSAAERYAEWHEGLAEYVGELSTARALGSPVEAARAAVRRSLGVPLSAFGGSPDERLIRARSYATGAALGLLLDQLAPDWRSRAFDVSLDELAAEAASLRTDQISTLARQARVRQDYTALLASTTPPWGSLTVMTEEFFYGRGKFRFIVELTSGAKHSFSLRTNANINTGMHRPLPGVMLLPDPARFQVQDGPLSLTVRSLPVRVAGPPGGAATTVTVLLPTAPLINGQPAVPGDHVLPSLEAGAQGIEVRVTGPARVTVESDRITVLRAAVERRR